MKLIKATSDLYPYIHAFMNISDLFIYSTKEVHKPVFIFNNITGCNFHSDFNLLQFAPKKCTKRSCLLV